jgi:hypothetical protein
MTSIEEELPDMTGWKYNHTPIYGKLFRFNKKAVFGVLSWKKSSYHQHINIIILLIELYIMYYCSLVTIFVSIIMMLGFYSFIICNDLKPTLVVMSGASSKSFFKTTVIIMSKLDELAKKYDTIHIINWECFKDEQTAYCNTTSMLQKVVSEKEFYNQVAVFINNLIKEMGITNVHFLGKCAGAGVGIRAVSFNTIFKYFQILFNSKLNSLITGGMDQYGYETQSPKLSLNAYKLGFQIQQSYFKAHFNYFYNNKHAFDFGVNSIYYKLQPGNYDPIGTTSLIKSDHLQYEQGFENAVYFSDHYTVNSKLKIDAGIRASFFTALGPGNFNEYAPGVPRILANVIKTNNIADGAAAATYGGPEFRLGFRYVIDETTSIKGGINTQRQYIHSLSNSTAMAPTDIWKLSDPNIKPQLGSQISLGLYKNMRSNTIEASVEVYYKDIQNYLDYKSGAKLIMNHNIETDVIGTKGKAYGAEFLIKKLTGKLNGWISYTYSRVLLQQSDPSAGEIINNGVAYPANYDKPNDATIIANYKFSHRFSISANATYSTGRPITLPIGLFEYGGSYRTLYANRNSYRIPDYFRTDFSINIEGNHKVRQLLHNSWSIGVYNLTGQRNPYSIYYVSENGNVNGYKLSIFGNAIPYINLNIRFK